MALITGSILMDLTILVTGLFGFLYWLATKNFGHWRKKGVPYLEPKPFVGNVGDLVLAKTSMGELLAKLYFESPGKPYVGMFGFHRPILLVRDRDLIKSILVKDFNHFRDRTFSPDERHDPLFTKNLFGMNGNRWRHLRVKLTPTFTSGKMKLMYDLVNECAGEMVQLMDRELRASKGGVVEIREVMARFTTDVVASVGFGLQGNALRDPNAEFRLVLRKLLDFNVWKGLKASMAFFAPQLLTTFNLPVFGPEITVFTRRVVWDAVEHRRTTGQRRRDFLELLIQLKDKGRLEGEDAQILGQTNGSAKGAAETDENYKLDGDDFVAQAFVFLAAGFETSSTTQMFALYELARHPDAQRRLREEVREAARAGGGRLSYDALFALPFLEQVVQETMRMYPVVTFLDRIAVQDYQLPNTKVVLEKGTTVMIPIFGIQRDPEIFDDPNTFKPERFGEGKGSIPPFAHMPFGEGPRICIGMRMGLMQVKVGLAHFFNNFSVSLSERMQKPLKFDPTSFLLASKGGTHLCVTRLADAEPMR